jgi:hypothetical protein
MAGGLSIKNLHDLIEAAARSHPSVKSFGSGERHLISPGGGTESVNVWLEQPFFRTLQIPERGSPTRTYRVQFMVLDIPMEDRSDELDIISRCDLIADWIIIKLNEESDVWLGQSISVMSLAAYHGDLWAGVRVELELTTGMPIDACDVRNL